MLLWTCLAAYEEHAKLLVLHAVIPRGLPALVQVKDDQRLACCGCGSDSGEDGGATRRSDADGLAPRSRTSSSGNCRLRHSPRPYRRSERAVILRLGLVSRLCRGRPAANSGLAPPQRWASGQYGTFLSLVPARWSARHADAVRQRDSGSLACCYANRECW